MDQPALIERWRIISGETPKGYLKSTEKYVEGQVYNDEFRPDGFFIITNAILEVQGDIVLTEHGREYRLGNPIDPYQRAKLDACKASPGSIRP